MTANEFNLYMFDQQILDLLTKASGLRAAADVCRQNPSAGSETAMLTMAITLEESARVMISDAERFGLISRDDWRRINRIVLHIGTGMTIEEMKTW